MTERQLRQTLSNRTRTGPGALFSEQCVAEVLTGASRVLHTLEDAGAAWARIAEPAWLARTEVTAFRDHTLSISVNGSTLRYDLARRGAALQRRLARYVHGIARVQFIPAAMPEEGTTAQ